MKQLLLDSILAASNGDRLLTFNEDGTGTGALVVGVRVEN